MATYKVPVSYTFKGHFVINAENKAQAEEWAEKHCGLVIGGNIHTSLSDDEVPDWDFPVHPEKKIGKARRS